ncbi:asparagine synthase (glutamine-hydrolyzing) [Rugamonas sp. FT107W]|uniref:asparagine synthase (glutamine-hydrolyzing) n=1 Tax=Duganella vulcania TaxID=2692166 RepID=A0A845HHT1_9BURK|nr:asparagine synthase (glutamine-hydrolyzing) [Duganella vulcania]MYN16953.1 asparagine synthase (glutamine-hydrolyzing) [Duganella vulcania]
MCGIWGLISHDGAERRRAALAAAFRFIDRRGPDARGEQHLTFDAHHVMLAHSRLAIIELSELGAQPMVDAGSGWWLVYNGEIYNYRDIREQLRGAGHAFRGGSDTEVLLRAWAVWGTDALPRLNGMFAFAAFNQRSGELWLVRDRFGVKPLLWGRRADGALTFGSSAAAVAEQVGAEIDTAYCARGVRYKAYETEQSGSAFKHVASVPAGGWVRFQLAAGRIEVSEGRWYCLATAVAARRAAMAGLGVPALLDQCRDWLDSAISLRLRSDVPLAVSLSAGLDSAAIACATRRQATRLRAFSFGSPAARASEGPATRAMSDAAGIDVSFVWPRWNRGQLCDMLETTMALQEAPFSGLSPMAQHAVFRDAGAAGFKVLLGGQGSDEIFAGYRKFMPVALREALRSREPEGALRLLYSLALMLAHEARQARMYLQNLARYRNGKAQPFRLIDWEAQAHNLWGESDLSLSDRQIADIQRWSLPTLLRYEDRNSMGCGVESRLPFLDYRLVEFALALPVRLKIGNGFGKWALRRITGGLVPDQIRLNRTKRGFDVTQDWIAQGLGASLRARIFDHRTALSGALKTDAQLDAHLSDAALSRSPELLDEALLLAWLVKPTRAPAAAPRQAGRREVRA